ncbi:MAG TPA: efflux RND transporter periplasmic adaptor subunit, partial [Myxococcaceae bacterium]|nr:efflux RND transporter periplasmic adaptor subunit [Myxococcaceae bacterium]
VKKGDVLARVDAELRTAGLKSAQAAYDKAKLDYERARTLHEAASIPASQLEAARLGFESSEAQLVVAQRQAKDTTIRAPISGTVTSRPVEVGGMLDHGKQVATLVDVSALKVRVRVAERDAFRIKPGDPVSVTTEVYPGHEFHGKVRSIGVKADEARTFLVEVDLPNSPELPLRAGLFGRVAFASKGGRKGVVIPREALVGSIRKPQVYVVQDGVARLRDIVIDAEEGMTLGVASGLNAGESLVVHGQSNLKDGVKVEVSRQATALAEPTAQTPRQETAR